MIVLILLLSSLINSLGSISVIDGSRIVLVSGVTVKRPGIHSVSEVEIGEYTKVAVFLLIHFVSGIEKLLEALVTADSLFKLKLTGHSVLHTAVSITRELEVDVLHSLLGELFIHSFDVIEGSKRSHYGDRDRKDLFGSLYSTECLNIERNAVSKLALIDLRDNTLICEVITVSYRHTEPGSVVRGLILGRSRIRKGDILHHIVSNVLSVGNDRPLGVCAYRNGISDVIAILRSGCELHLNGVVVTERTCVIGGKRCKSVTLLNDTNESALFRTELFDGV